MCLAFVDYEKAFDSVEHLGIINAIKNHGINEADIDLLTNIYNNGYAETRLDTVSPKFPIRRGVRQGDNLTKVVQCRARRCIQKIETGYNRHTGKW